MPPVQKKVKMDMRDMRRDTTRDCTESTSSASRLASSSAASFPKRDECPGTHCSLIEQEREDSFRQICQRVSGKRKDKGEDRVARTERESDRREVADLLVLPRPAKSVQNGTGLSGKT